MGGASRRGNTAFLNQHGVQIMARMAFAAAQGGFKVEFAKGELSLVPTEAEKTVGWSIDEETMGAGWHDSSWMLKKGLDVIEGLPPGAVPPEWALRWWVASNTPLAARPA